RHMNELARLILDGGDDLGMAVTRRGHGDAGGHVQKAIAVHIFNHGAGAASNDQRIAAGVRWRNEPGVAIEEFLTARAGQGGLEAGNRVLIEAPHGQTSGTIVSCDCARHPAAALTAAKAGEWCLLSVIVTTSR